MGATATRGWAGAGSTGAWRRVRAVVLERDGHQCQINGPRCTGVADTVDHIIRKADGGSDDPNNLRAACARDNYGRRDPDAAASRSTLVETRTAW